MTDTEPHVADEQTLDKIQQLAFARDLREAIDNAYHLGRIRGRMEGVESALLGVNDAIGAA